MGMLLSQHTHNYKPVTALWGGAVMLPSLPIPKGLQEDEGRASKMLPLYAQSLLLLDCRQLNISIIPPKIFLKNNYSP